jgi:hypothetical protein
MDSSTACSARRGDAAGSDECGEEGDQQSGGHDRQPCGSSRSLWPIGSRPWPDILEAAEYAQRTGWHGVRIADHFMANGAEGVGGTDERVHGAVGGAREPNHWSLPELAVHTGEVFRRHCEKIGRDPGTVRRSTQALIEVVVPGDTEDEERRERLLAARRQPVVMGSAEELLDTFGRYAEAGIDELLIPDVTLGDGQRWLDALERLREKVIVKLG